MTPILHITHRQQWDPEADEYRADSLESEGFIHCSTLAQVVKTANRFFHGQSGLVLLCIDPTQVTAEIRYEEAEIGEVFPHIYGPLNISAVVRVIDFEPSAEGEFELPSALREQAL